MESDKIFCVTYELYGELAEAFVIAPSFSEALATWRDYIRREHRIDYLDPTSVMLVTDGTILKAC